MSLSNFSPLRWNILKIHKILSEKLVSHCVNEWDVLRDFLTEKKLNQSNASIGGIRFVYNRSYDVTRMGLPAGPSFASSVTPGVNREYECPVVTSMIGRRQAE